MVTKWILSGEPFEENSARLKDDYLSGTSKLCAPSFMVQEVTNSVWKGIKRKRILQDDAMQAFQTLNDLNIKLFELDWINAAQVLSIASKLDLAVYDAAYLFLTNQVEGCLITADDKLNEKATGQFRTLHIKDYL